MRLCRSRIMFLTVPLCLAAGAVMTMGGCGQGPSFIDGIGDGEDVVLVPSKYFTNTSVPVNLGIPRTWNLESVGTSVLLPEELADAQVMAAFAGERGQRVVLFSLADWRAGQVKSTMRKELESEAYLDLDDPGDLFAIAGVGLRARSPNQLLGIAVAEVPGNADRHLGVVELIQANSDDEMKRELVRSVQSFSIDSPK